MEYLIICAVTVVACLGTLFSGFGLGTILMPVLAVFFPLELAVAMTAIVHLFNNTLKLVLFARNADGGVVLRFGLPAVAAAFIGAQLLVTLGNSDPIWQYTLGSRICAVTSLELLMAVLIFAFAVLDLWPWFQNLNFQRKYLPAGGLLSGFFGGLSGHQGAFRSMFLIRAGLSKEGFIATGVVIACLVDVMRLGVYSGHFSGKGIAENMSLLFLVCLCALAGTLLGNRFIKKVTMPFIQKLVSVLLIVIALGMGSGII
jgi:uncharacterized protein